MQTNDELRDLFSSARIHGRSLTRADVAQLTGTTVQAVGQWLNDKRVFSQGHLDLLKLHLGLEIPECKKPKRDRRVAA